MTQKEILDYLKSHHKTAQRSRAALAAKVRRRENIANITVHDGWATMARIDAQHAQQRVDARDKEMAILDTVMDLVIEHIKE